MVDTLLKHRKTSQVSTILQRPGIRLNDRTRETGKYALVNLHRSSNVDDRETFLEILLALTTIGSKVLVIFPMHPRTVARVKEFGFEAHCRVLSASEKLDHHGRGPYCIEPLFYLDVPCLTSNATLVLTRSGGIQEETTTLGVPCVTLRDNTECPVTITEGANILAGTRKGRIISHAVRRLKSSHKTGRPKFLDGRAGERIIRDLVKKINASRK